MVFTIQNADVKQGRVENALVIGVSHCAVFGAEDESGAAFTLLQAVQLVNERLLQLKTSDSSSVQMEVVLICTNIQQQQKDQIQTKTRESGLQIHRFSFYEDNLTDCLLENKVDLFLTTDSEEAKQAASKGVLCTLLDPLSAHGPSEQLRVMFCADAILDLNTGSHQAFWSHLGDIRQRLGVEDSPLALVLLSSHGGINACCSALRSLRTLGLSVDEAYCLGGSPRKPIMSLLRPHFLLGAPKE
ncbi:unnamed protein product [Knipowitschia caucasica]|uniref:Cytosolic 5'-nucleotidase 1A-like n=1 Tax=Knipowitschia caucasica TaxID=637954 RepID=A0AAV2KZG8_KNICA